MIKPLLTCYCIKILKGCFALLLVQFAFSSMNLKAQGNLLLMPRRIVFEGSKKYEEISLANTGKDTARYVISLMHVRMKEDGSFEEINEPGPGENFADRYLRFFPRNVVLGPDESQVVKVQLNRVNELQQGEYRSHLYFRAVPNAVPLGTQQASNDSGISVKLVPVFGISIPVIIHVGELKAGINLSEPFVQMAEDTIPVLNLTFLREGNKSVYGDLSVDYITAQGKTISAGVIKGIAVYTPNTLRRFKLNLENHPGIDYHTGKLHITYSSPVESKPERYAETELVLH